MGIQDLKKYIPAVFFVFLLLAVLIRPDDVSGVISSGEMSCQMFIIVVLSVFLFYVIKFKLIN